jgi:hypothetical protein
VIVDTLAAVSTRAWLSGPTADEAKQFAKRAALASITVSMLGNTLYHLILSGALRPSVALVIGVAMIPPLGLAAAAHLVAVLRSAEPATAPQTDTAPTVAPMPSDAVPADAASVLIVADSTPDTGPDTKRTPHRTDTAAKVAKLAAKHPDMKPAAMAVKLGVSDRTVRRHLATLATA